MIRIQKITKLHHPGVLRDFEWPADLPMFGRFNLIYGWNGSGKTTLSNVFRCLEQRIVPSEGQVILEIDDVKVAGEHFASSRLPIRVFNRDFVRESIFPVGGGDIPPIFIVGKESVEKQKEADRVKGERTTAESSLSTARSQEQDAKKEFDKFSSDRARIIKETLRSPGSNPYNNYDKAAFQGDSQKMAEEDNAESHLLNEAEREKLLTQHRATPKPKIQKVVFAIPSLQELADSIRSITSTTVVSAAIQSLKDDSTLAEWTRHGLGLHKEYQSKKCLFCEQLLPDERLASLEAHFSVEYEQLLQMIDELIGQLHESSKEARQLRLPNRAEFFDDLALAYDASLKSLSQSLSEYHEFVERLVEALNAKKSRLFTSQDLLVYVPNVSTRAVDDINEVIEKHNQACDEFDARVRNARNRLALDMIAAVLPDYLQLRSHLREAAEAIPPLEQRVQQLTESIVRLEIEIIEHRRPAEDLNEDLAQYLGHRELQFTVKETGYIITRNDEPATLLSEGEMTAIAILYFLKSLEDRNFDQRNGVVVLDDPVSSLDANALFLALGFIRHRTQDSGQLFILTHSFSFFRQVRNWFYHQKGQKKRDIIQRPSRFYMLDRVHGSAPRCTALCALDPLLERYESEYHYLFACVYRSANAIGKTNLEQNYCLPNIARRLLEMFLAFRQPHIAGELHTKLENINFDKAKKLRVLRFVHTHSHGDAVGEPEHESNALGEAGAVLSNLLEMIRSEDASHFAAMESLIVSAAEDVESE